jgi:membrane protease YdiL (CAAX protease family)
MKTKRPYSGACFLLALSVLMALAGAPLVIVMVVATLLIANFCLARSCTLGELGITRKRVWPAIRVQLPFTVLGLVGLFAYAYLSNRLPLPTEKFAAYWLVSVPLQELIFRGYAQSVLRKFLKPFNTALLAAMIFSLMHFFLDAPYAPVLVAATFVSGVAWGFAYEKERNLAGPIFGHEILGTVMLLVLQ